MLYHGRCRDVPLSVRAAHETWDERRPQMSDPPIGDQRDPAEQEVSAFHTADAGDASESQTVRSETRPASVRGGAGRCAALGLQVASLALLVAVVVAVTASLAAGRRRTSPTVQTTAQVTIVGGIVTAETTPTPASPFGDPPIGPMPTNCATSPTADPVGPPTAGRAVGADPVWVDGFDGGAATISIPNHATGPYASDGWPVQIALVFKRPFSATVTLDGVSPTTFAPLSFSFHGPDGGTPPSAGFALDPHNVQDLYSSWDDTSAFWFGTLFLPGAGCYALSASWSGGGWRADFAAGS